ncbi:hypothetical protein KC717_05800 [Candidatus Dojkabacteria bacterium]|uniref:Uncharacterized protein n=1 Tax=Candidatus Dojkabacteria bacterium TaxID=2099670 RepID=A0A955L8S7_9BACT|nr:hypothetical protein [Candidatus Dojkabacteria bacterium]
MTETKTSNTSDTATPSPKKGGNGKVILIIVLVVLFLCMIACGSIFLYTRYKAQEFRDTNNWDDIINEYSDTINDPDRFLEDPEGIVDDFGNPGSDHNSDTSRPVEAPQDGEYVSLGASAGAEGWSLAVLGAERVEDSIVLTLEVTNETASPQSFSTLLSLSLHSKSGAEGDSEYGYAQDFFMDTDRNLLDSEVPAGETFTAELPFIVEDGSDLSDLYLEFEPNFFSEDVFYYDIQ